MERRRKKLAEETSNSGSESSDSDSSHPHSSYPNDPVGSALSNPVVLELVFPNLDVTSLKSCRRVCSIWSATARPFLYSKSEVLLVGPVEGGRSGSPRRVSLQYGLRQLQAADILSSSNDKLKVNYRTYNRELKLVPILDKIQRNVQSLTLHMNPHKEGDSFLGGPFTDVGFRNLKSITVESTCELVGSKDDDKEKENVLLLLEIIERSPNLEEFNFSNDESQLMRIFFKTLLGPEGLPGNGRFKETLKSVRMNKSVDVINQDIEAFRQMKLKLTTLSVPIIAGENAVLQVPALSMWLKDLSSTLEYLYLYCLNYGHPVRSWNLEFPTEMKKLKTLRIRKPELFGVEAIIPLLERMPNLETLILTQANCTGVKGLYFIDESFKKFSFPNLKQLVIWTPFNGSDCQPSKYVPKLFPNLKELSMNVYSKKSLLACIYELKDTMIEELVLELQDSTEELETQVKTCVPWGWSLISWKKLRKLSLNYPTCEKCERCKDEVRSCTTTHDSSLTKVYNIPMECILPGTLTSLTLRNLGRIEASFLVKLLQGMPLLMHLDFEGEGCIVNEKGSRMKRSLFMDKIRKDPCINPYLHIPNWDGLFCTTTCTCLTE